MAKSHKKPKVVPPNKKNAAKRAKQQKATHEVIKRIEQANASKTK